MSELDQFRTKWLHALKVDVQKESGDKPCVSPQYEVDSSRVKDAVNDLTSSSTFRGRHRHQRAQRGKQVFKFESNTSCQSNPRAFDIADRLLQGEFLTGEYLFTERGNKRNRGKTSIDRIEAKKVPLSKKSCKVQPSYSLLDAFLSDLDDINEIPFFDVCLPREVAINIFRNLDIIDLCRCAQVSKSWRSIADDELLWHCHSCRMGYVDDTTVVERNGWKNFLRSQMQEEASLRHNWKNRIGRLYELEYARAGVLSAVDSFDDLVIAGYSSGEVGVWQRTPSGVEIRTVAVDAAVFLNDFNHVSSVSLSKNQVIVAYAKGEVCVGQVGGATSSSPGWPSRCQQVLSLPGPAHVTASRTDNHFVAFGGTRALLCCPKKGAQTAQLSTKISHMLLAPAPTGTCCPMVVTAADDAVRLHAGDALGADGVILHHLIGATVTCMDAADHVLALGVTDRSAVNVFQVPLYASNSAKFLGTLTSHTSSVLCVNVTGCPENLILTGSCDKNARIFDLRTLQCEVCISAHGLGVSQLQMDQYSLVTGGQDGLVCVWDLRSKAKLWEMFSRHPVRHLQANPSTLVTAHIPQVLFPEPQDGDVVVHARQRGTVRVYDFAANQDTTGIPSICLSSYDEPAGYNYNVRLAVPYDDIVEI